MSLRGKGPVLLAALALICALSPLEARPKLSKGPFPVAEADRAAIEGRAVQISLETPEIGASSDVGRVAEYLYVNSCDGTWCWVGGPVSEAGSLTVLADREAQARAEPLRKALSGFDGAKLTIDATRAGIEAVAWMNPKPLEVMGRPRDSDPLDFADFAPGEHFGIVGSGYYLSPDCSHIEFRAQIGLVHKVKKKLVVTGYQQVISVVRLAQPSLDANGNIRRWSANNGALARTAIVAGAARLGLMIPRSLNLTAAEIAGFAAKDRTMAQAAGRFGPVLERDHDGPGSVMIWSKGLVSVQTLSAK